MEKLKNWWNRRPYYRYERNNYAVERSTVRKLSIPWLGLEFSAKRTVMKKFEDWI